MPQPTLPAELIRDIIKQIDSDDKEQGPNHIRNALVACCRASKALLPFARKRLYQSPVIEHNEYDSSFLRTVVGAPQLAAMVRSLEIWTPSGPDTLNETIAACVNVRKIFLHCGNGYLTGGDVQQAIAGSAGTLETLELERGGRWEAGDVLKFFTSFKHLKHLKVDMIELVDYSWFRLGDCAPPTFSLVSFEERKGMEVALMNKILKGSTESLESLATDGVHRQCGARPAAFRAPPQHRFALASAHRSPRY